MAALTAGSKRFVATGIHLLVVTEMYASLIGIAMQKSRTNGFNADLRDYARWEYGRSDVAWLYAHAASRRKRKLRLLPRLGAWFRGDVRLPTLPTPEYRPR